MENDRPRVEPIAAQLGKQRENADATALLEEHSPTLLLELCRRGSGGSRGESAAMRLLLPMLTPGSRERLELDPRTVLSVIESQIFRNFDEGLTNQALSLGEPLAQGKGVDVADVPFRLLAAYSKTFPHAPVPPQFWRRVIRILAMSTPGPAERASVWIRWHIATSGSRRTELVGKITNVLKSFLAKWTTLSTPLAAVNVLSFLRRIAPQGWTPTFLQFLASSNPVVSLHALSELSKEAPSDGALRQAVVLRLLRVFPFTNLAKAQSFLRVIFALVVPDLVTSEFVGRIASIVSGPSPLLAESCVDRILGSEGFREGVRRKPDRLLPLARAALGLIFTKHGDELATYVSSVRPDLLGLARNNAQAAERHQVWQAIGRGNPRLGERLHDATIKEPARRNSLQEGDRNVARLCLR